jgi:hypothetical protein
MIKQIKKRLAATLVLVGFMACSIAAAQPASSSDVVESKSVIDEQIVLQQENYTEPTPYAGVIQTLAQEKVVTSTPEPIVEEKIFYDGWTTTGVNVRISPSINATVLTTYNFNTPIHYAIYDEEWVEIEYGSSVAYMAKEFISDTKCEYNEISVPSHSDFKSYMGYKAITNTGSKQYKIQSQYAYTGEYGIRQVDGRFCVALGSYFNVSIGQYFDLVLENGTIIPCIMGDAKADKDTDSQNIFSVNGCCSEFIVDTSALISSAKSRGSISYACDEWNSQVIAIRVYEENILN